MCSPCGKQSASYSPDLWKAVRLGSTICVVHSMLVLVSLFGCLAVGLSMYLTCAAISCRTTFANWRSGANVTFVIRFHVSASHVLYQGVGDMQGEDSWAVQLL